MIGLSGNQKIRKQMIRKTGYQRKPVISLPDTLIAWYPLPDTLIA
jgi:hypothetical protein